MAVEHVDGSTSSCKAIGVTWGRMTSPSTLALIEHMDANSEGNQSQASSAVTALARCEERARSDAQSAAEHINGSTTLARGIGKPWQGLFLPPPFGLIEVVGACSQKKGLPGAGNPRTRGPPWRGGPVGDGRGHTRVGGTIVRHGVDCHVAADDGCRGRCFESRRRCEGGACANTGRRPAGGGVALAAGLPRLSLLFSSLGRTPHCGQCRGSSRPLKS